MTYDQHKYDHAKAAPPARPKKARKPRPKAVVMCNGGCTEAGLCKSGCIGCGSCTNACRRGAISITPEGFAHVDPELCVGCGLCTRVCPQNVIAMVEPRFNITARCSNTEPGSVAKKVCATSCVSCRNCEKACPAGAIKVIDNHAVINWALCIACGMCATKCARGVIRDAFGILAEK